MRQLYLAATGQNRGKTTAALGLFDGFQRAGLKTAFMKPVGQRTVIDHGQPADEDAVLMHETFDLPADYRAMSPVHIPRGFTKAYIAGEVVEDLGARIVAARNTFQATQRDAPDRGHRSRRRRGGDRALECGGRGDARRRRRSSSARAASAGRSTRSSSTPRTSRAHGVPVAGAIVNKVDLDAQPGITGVLERGLANHGIRLLGVLPVRPILSNPTLGMILEGVQGETIHPGPDLDRVIDGVAIGAMEPRHMLERVGPGTLVIVPGDREDVILTLTTAHLAHRVRVAGATEAARIAQIAAEATNERTANVDGHEGAAIGLVLTGGYRPRDAGHRRDPPGRPLRDDRPRGHLQGRLRGPRPAGQDPPGGPREDRADQGARRGAPRHRADPRGRDRGAGGLIAASGCGRVAAPRRRLTVR